MGSNAVDIDAITAAVPEVADLTVVPRFQALAAADITEKTPGDYVTVADHECEAMLTDRLVKIAPDIPVLGEEAAAANPQLTARLMSEDRVFVMDPVDGTRAFIDGRTDFAVMLALIEKGETTAAWIWQPIPRVMFSAIRDGGAWRDGVPVRRHAAIPTQLSELHGFAKTGHMDDTTYRTVSANMHHLGSVGPGPASAGFIYPELAQGKTDFAMFWRTLPWDHAPGSLIAQEAGCYVARLDGTPYRADGSGEGILGAANRDTWQLVRDALLGD